MKMTIINRTDEPMEVTVEGKPVTLKENGGWVNTTADNPELLARGDARLEEMIAKGEVRIVEEWFHTIKPNRRHTMQRAEIIFLALRQLGFEGSFYDATDYLDELTEEARFNRFKSADFLEACSESVKEAYAEHKNIDRAYHADIIFNALEKAARE